jgi:hypothetical protein
MSDVIGAFRQPRTDLQVESLNLRFSPSSIPLQQRWRNNGLSADFLADYVTTFFPRVEDDPASETRRAEIKGAVNYIANELLENGMKYSAESLAFPIAILLQLDSERICFWETNTVTPNQATEYRAFIDRLMVTDPNEMYIEQLERSAEGGGSGLGFLTMINDYAAELAWTFEPAGSDGVTVTTCVSLAI